MAATTSFKRTKQQRFLIVGLVCLDIVNTLERFPREDEDIRAISQIWQKGGNAANTAVVLAQTLRTNTELLCSFNEGPEGQFAKEELNKRGVLIENSPTKSNTGFPTSCVIVNSVTGTRTIVHSRNELPELSFEDFDKLDLASYTWIHFEGRYNVTDIIQMIEKVEEFRCKTKVQLKISVELEKKRDDLKRLLPMADLVFLSKDFAQYCGFSSAKEAVLGLASQVKSTAILVCGWGESGAVAMECGSENLVSSRAFPPKQMIDTLGAGDTFNAGVMYYLEQDKTLQEALTFGCKLAGSKCGIAGFDRLGLDCFWDLHENK